MSDRRNIGENDSDFDNQRNSDINNQENDATIWDQKYFKLNFHFPVLIVLFSFKGKMKVMIKMKSHQIT